jgi:hypothetical protein
MADRSTSSLEVIRARRLAQAAAEFDRDVAEINRLAEKHNLDVILRAREDTAALSASASSTLSIEDLAKQYLTDPRSPYKKLRPASQGLYKRKIARIVRDCGNEKVGALTARKINNLHAHWSQGDKIAGSHGLVTMLRGLARFGMDELEEADCKNLAVTLHGLYFPNVKPREERLTAAQADAIRAEAHKRELPSIAIAQAFQFDCGLMQKDVIGEWVPLSDPAPSDIIRESEKWVRGLRWNEIDDDLVLRHPSAGKLIERQLAKLPMVRAELHRLGARPKSGPIVAYERSGRPYLENQFRLEWRAIADAVGVSKKIRNADSRPKRNEERSLRDKEIEPQRGQPL